MQHPIYLYRCNLYQNRYCRPSQMAYFRKFCFLQTSKDVQNGSKMTAPCFSTAHTISDRRVLVNCLLFKKTWSALINFGFPLLLSKKLCRYLLEMFGNQRGHCLVRCIWHITLAPVFSWVPQFHGSHKSMGPTCILHEQLLSFLDIQRILPKFISCDDLFRDFM